MANINLSKRFYEKNVLEGCKEIFKEMYSTTSKSGYYIINENNLILPEILAVCLKAGFNLSIFLNDFGSCPTGCNVKIFNKKDNKEGEILKISFSGPPNYRAKDSEAYKRQILEAKDSAECENIISELNKIYL